MVKLTVTLVGTMMVWALMSFVLLCQESLLVLMDLISRYVCSVLAFWIIVR